MIFNRIPIAFRGLDRVIGPAISYQYDVKTVLEFTDLELPEYYEADFCNEGDAETVTMVGTAGGVQVPDQFMATGKPVKCFIVVQGTDDGAVETRRELTLPVTARQARSDLQPTPAQQQQIDELVAAMNEAVEDADSSAEDAEAWAVGERDGVPVGPEDPTYQNNAKWYSDHMHEGVVTGVKGAAETDYRDGNVSISPADLGLGNVDNTSDMDKPVSTATQDALDGKVDKVPGKGLSEEDFTAAEKAKLAGIEAGAQVNSVTGVKGGAETDYRTGNVNITKANVGLGNADNTSDADKPVSTATQAALDLKLDSSEKGAANGVAELDATGKVPSSELPSYVDDIIEGYLYNGVFYEDAAHTTQITGETGKIYVDLSTNKTYRWSGSGYVEISESLALGETSSTAYRGDRGKTAYDDSQANKANIGTMASLTTTDKSTLVGAINELEAGKVDKVQGKGLSEEDFTAAEKAKLAGIEAGAEVNVQADWSQTDTAADDYIRNKPSIPEDAGDIAYDSAETYDSGTVGAELSGLRNSLSNLGLIVSEGKLCVCYDA